MKRICANLSANVSVRDVVASVITFCSGALRYSIFL